MGLTPKQQQFVAEFAIDMNATQAAIRAGYSKRTANEQGARLLANVSIAAAIASACAKNIKAAEIEGQQVIRELARIAIGDVRKLVEYRRTCCRHCFGKGFMYQCTSEEMAERRIMHARNIERRQRRRERAASRGLDLDDDDDDDDDEFDERGGVGYVASKDPNPECPHCDGLGLGDVFIHDTRRYDEDARALYAGVKRTRDGIEVKVVSKEHALELLGRYFKLFTDKLEIKADDDIATLLAAARARKDTSERPIGDRDQDLPDPGTAPRDA